MDWQTFSESYEIEAVNFDEDRGYPNGKDLFYRCDLCLEVIPSSMQVIKSYPKTYLEEFQCACKNLHTDFSMGRMGTRQKKTISLWRVLGEK